MFDETAPIDDGEAKIPSELNDFINQLKTFQPAASSVDRDQLLYRAWERSARQDLAKEIAGWRRQLRCWQAATSACVLSLLGMGIGWHQSFHQQMVPTLHEQVVDLTPSPQLSDQVQPVNSSELTNDSIPLVFDGSNEGRELYAEFFRHDQSNTTGTKFDSMDDKQPTLKRPVLTQRFLVQDAVNAFSLSQLIEESNL